MLFRALACTDIMAHCRTPDDQPLIVGVEGKSTETFDKPIKEWIVSGRGAPSPTRCDGSNISARCSVCLSLRILRYASSLYILKIFQKTKPILDLSGWNFREWVGWSSR